MAYGIIIGIWWHRWVEIELEKRGLVSGIIKGWRHRCGEGDRLYYSYNSNIKHIAYAKYPALQ